MSGHNKWAQIKHQKNATDQKRGQLFSKLLNSISVAAKINPNLQFNLRLRTAIQKAKDANVPRDNIERALKRASELEENLEELILEAYGPGGTAILMEAITNNKNRTVAEIKKILNDKGGKWAETGSVRWAFELNFQGQDGWRAKFIHLSNPEDNLKLKNLIAVLENHSDIQKVITNTSS